MKSKLIKLTKSIMNKIKLFKIKKYYKNQITNEFLTKTDYLDYKMKKEIIKYYKQYGVNIKTYWHKWYSSRNGVKDIRYIPEDLYYCYIEPYFCNYKLYKSISDKNYYDIWFPNVKLPKTLIRNIAGVLYDSNYNIISQDDAFNICTNYNELVIKPSIDTGGGKNVNFINSNILKFKNDLLNLLNTYNMDYLIQEPLQQHNLLNEINHTSINTIRTISFLFNNEVHILSSILRIGVNGNRTDNESAGGISVGISNDGKLKPIAYDRYGNKFYNHPQNGNFAGKIISSYDKITELIIKNHAKFGHFKIISWDFCIGYDNEPILIEFNLAGQGINFHQMDNGPLFGELTDNVLEVVFKKNN